MSNNKQILKVTIPQSNPAPKPKTPAPRPTPSQGQTVTKG